MNIREVTKTLKSLGWLTFTDEVGDKFTHFHLPGSTVQIIYGLDRIRGEQKLGAMLSLTTDSFSEACSEIRGEKYTYYPLVRAWSGLDIRTPEILEEHVRQASDEAIAWAQAQDLDHALQEYAALPTTAPGARPVWHLGALAVLGDIERLKSYQARFEAGDRLGFVNYVTKDFIDRAVALAGQNAAGA